MAYILQTTREGGKPMTRIKQRFEGTESKHKGLMKNHKNRKLRKRKSR